jgi:hypothetical protein
MDRFYTDPISGDKYPSVTTIVGQMPKPGVSYWAAGVAAQYAVDHPGASVEEIKRAPRAQTEEASERGTRVHASILTRKWPSDLAPYAASYRRLCREHTIEPYVQERVVFSRYHRYAGTCDFVGWVDGELTLIDWKTSNNLYPATRLQLAGYRWSDDFADWPIQHCMIGWIRPDRAELVRQKVGVEEWAQFLRLRKTYDWR